MAKQSQLDKVIASMKADIDFKERELAALMHAVAKMEAARPVKAVKA